jgi:hypothetical protein
MKHEFAIQCSDAQQRESGLWFFTITVGGLSTEKRATEVGYALRSMIVEHGGAYGIGDLVGEKLGN